MNLMTQHNRPSAISNSLSQSLFEHSTHISLATGKIINLVGHGNFEVNNMEVNDFQLTIFMYFLVTDSLVCNKNVLIEVFKKIVSGQLEIHLLDNKFFIEINEQIEGFGVNSNDGEKRTSLIRIILTPIASGALYKLLSVIHSNEVNCFNLSSSHESDEEYILKHVNKLMKHLGFKKFSSLSVFCQSAAEAAMREKCTELPVFLKEYITGKLPSHPMPLQSLRMFDGRKLHDDKNILPLEKTHIKPSHNKARMLKDFTESKLQKGHLEFSELDTHFLSLFTVDRNEDIETSRSAMLELIEKELRKEVLPLPATLLLDWFVFKLKRDKNPIHATTVKNYYKKVGQLWLTHTTGEDISELNGAEMDVLCQLITENDIDSSIQQRLRDLIIFGCNEGKLAAPDDPYYTVKNPLKYVRSTVIPNNIVVQVSKKLSESLPERDQHTQLTFRSLFIVQSRVMLRPSETTMLRICDIELSKEGWLLVRPHSNKRLKTLNSKRKVPYGILLTSQERKTFEDFVRYRIRQSGTKAPLFVKQPNTIETYSTTEVEQVISPLLSQYFGYPVPLYQFRHTGITTLLFLIFGSEKLIKQYTQYDLQQAEQIKRVLIGDRKRDKLWAIAHLAGHQTPSTTAFSYSHNFEILIDDILSRSEHFYSADFWLNLTGLPANRIKNLLKTKTLEFSLDTNQKSISTHEMIPALITKMAKFVTKDSTKDTRKYIEQEIDVPVIRPDILECYKVLKLKDRGYSKNSIVLKSPIEEGLVLSWLLASEAVINRYKTPHGNSRLVKKDGSHCPTLPSDPDLTDAIDKFRQELRCKRSELLWCVEYVLSHSTKDKKFIRFNELSNLQKFLKIAQLIYAEDRWYAQVFTNNSCIESLNPINNITRIKQLANSGVKGFHIRLILVNVNVNVNANTEQAREFTPSSAFTFLCHMAKVMTVAHSQISKK